MATKPIEPVGETAATLSLAEFCARLSETVRRPELISGFEHKSKAAGQRRDTWDNFKSQFDEFVNSPA